MTRVAVIGANGQVGAELCLMLAQRSDFELIAICRNRSGSAFLRWHGVPCRHGRVADPTEAARLIGDCDFIVNSALATGSPAEIRRTEDCIIGNLFAYSKKSATVLHFSTQSVYGDPRPHRLMRRQNPYGRAKLASEKRVRAAHRETRKVTYILRLGHVCGTLQEISNGIRDSIRRDAVVLPARDCSSNTVYTAAIVGALLQVIQGKTVPGTYDLMNSPLWTWREVYEYEAQACGIPLNVATAPESSRPSFVGALAGRSLRTVRSLLSAPAAVEFGTKCFAHLPDSINARAMAWWYAKRASREIAGLRRAVNLPEHLSWISNGVNFFPAATPTRELLQILAPASAAPRVGGNSWPSDLPDASVDEICG